MLLIVVIIYKFYNKEGFFCSWAEKANEAKRTMEHEKNTYYSEKQNYEAKVAEANKQLIDKINEVASNNNDMDLLYTDMGSIFYNVDESKNKIDEENTWLIKANSNTMNSLNTCYEQNKLKLEGNDIMS
jgi:hypothetical protein